jgi:peptide deformylase
MPVVLQYPDVRLRNKAVEVSHDDPMVPGLISALTGAMKLDGGIAVAANQIGAQIRVIAFDPSTMKDVDGNPVDHMINPKIIESSEDSIFGKEGCLSFRDFFISVSRPTTVTAQWVDMEGNEHQGTFKDLPARCLQHEIDHLDGVLMIDRMPKLLRGPALLKYQKKLMRGYKT